MPKKQKPEVSDWQVMVDAATRGLEEKGYQLTRMPGRGLSNVWSVARGGVTQKASIRTTRNRWFAFPPLAGGTKWKTLDDVDLVVVASVDSQDKPANVEIYVFQADEVRQCFSAALAARKAAGQTVRDDFGMWIALDTDTRNVPTSVGSGLAEKYPAVATYSLASLEADEKARPAVAAPSASLSVREESQKPESIADVLSRARQRVAELAGVSVEAVKLDLKIEY